MLDYIKDMEIDENALDVEWLNQPELARKYGKHLTELNQIMLKADEKVKTIRSELILKANEIDSEQVFNKKKPTMADIEAYYRTQPEYIEAKEAYLKAKEEYEYAEVITNEVRFTRKNALEQLVLLYNGNYFAGPSVPRNLSEERKSINVKLNRK
jgi:hypothetical protein